MYRFKQLVEHPPSYASITLKVPRVLTEKGGFTKTIQIFTVPYSFPEVVLIDFALSQPTLFKEIR